MSPYRRGGVHRTNQLYFFVDLYKLQIIVVKPFVRHKLLQESDQLNSVVFIRLRQVDILQVQYQPCALLGLQNTALAVISF